MNKFISLFLLYSCLNLFLIGSSFDIHGGISPDPQNFLHKYAMVRIIITSLQLPEYGPNYRVSTT